MNNDSLNYFFQLLSFKLKECAPMNTAVKGDFNRYSSILSDIYKNIFRHANYDIKAEDGKEIHIHFDNSNNDVSIEAFDESQFYNQLSIYMTENHNKLEFIASNVPARGEQPTCREESEYIYEPETGKYYIYYGKTSYINNEHLMMIQVYDEKGNEEHRSMNSRNFEAPMVKTKKKKPYDQ